VFETAAGIVKHNKIDAAFVAVDGTTARDLVEKFQIKGFPTLRLFK